MKSEGYTIALPGRETKPGSNIVADVQNALVQAKKAIVVLSPDYLNTRFTHEEWNVTLQHRRTEEQTSIFPVQVRECKPLLRDHEHEVDMIDLVGKDEATARTMLLEGIQHKLRKARVFDAFTLPPVWNIGHKRNPFFVEREDILHTIYKAFKEDKSTTLSQPLALIGLEGIGKTQIAIEYAYRYKNEYQCLFWAQANSPETLESSFVEIAKLLRLPRVLEQDTNSNVSAIKYWLQGNARWLLILDNVEDLGIVDSYIPPGCKGDILLTTHIQSLGTVAQPIEVGPMRQKNSALFLLRRINKLALDAPLEQASEVDRACALQIAHLLDGLPLALDQAGAYIEETGYSLAGYLDRYHHQRLELLRHRSRLRLEHPNSVAFTWSISFDNVRRTNPVAAALLCLCAFLYCEAIPEELLIQATVGDDKELGPAPRDQFELDEAIEELRRYSFIRRNSSNKTLSIHQLIQVVLKDSMDESRQKRWAERVVRAVNHVFPDVKFQNWDRCRRYMPHVDACSELIAQLQIDTLEAGRLLQKGGAYCLERTQYDKVERFYQQALTIHETLLGTGDLDVAATLNELAWLHRTKGNYMEAEKLYQRARRIRETALGPEHPDVATTLNDLAWTYYNLGQYEQAEGLYKKALAIRERNLPPDHQDIATSINNLARLYHKKGQFALAEQLYLRALDIRRHGRDALAPDHPYIATSLNNLALLYQYQAREDMAIEYYKEALKIRQKVFKDIEHPDIAMSLNGLAQLYYAQGQYAQAEVYFEEALQIWKKAFQPDHPHIAKAFNNLARLYRIQGRYMEAEEYFRKALAIRETRLGPEHPDVAQTLDYLARLYRSKGSYDEAERIYQHALSIREKKLGLEHPDVAQTLNNLARLYQVQGKYSESEKTHRRALHIREKVFGPNHPDVAQTLNNLARLYLKQGQYAQAEELGRQALAIWSQAFGDGHHYLAFIFNNMGEIAYARKAYIEAEQMYLRALDIQQRVGMQHPHIAFIFNNLAEIRLIQERYREAEAYLEKAVDIRTRVLGPNHPYIAFSQTILAKVYLAQGRHDEAEVVLKRAIQIRRSTLGAVHPDIAISLITLAQTYEAQNEFEKAKSYFQQALALRKHALDPHHPDVTEITDIYISFLRKIGQDAGTSAIQERINTLQRLDTQAL